MSKYRTHFYLTFDTEAHAETVKNAILSVLATKPSLSNVSAIVDYDEEHRPKIDGDFYYETTSSREIVKGWVNQQRITLPVKNWIQTGWVCSHKWDANLAKDDPNCEFEEIFI